MAKQTERAIDKFKETTLLAKVAKSIAPSCICFESRPAKLSNSLKKKQNKGYYGTYIGSQFIGTILYVDAITLLSGSCRGLQKMLDICAEFGHKWDICFSAEWVSSFLTAHQHIIGYSVPYSGLENAIKDGKYNQGYLAMIKYE